MTKTIVPLLLSQRLADVILFICALVGCCCLPTALAYTNNGGIIQDLMHRAFIPKADLPNLASDLFGGKILDIRLDVADPRRNKQNRMAVQNIVLQLHAKKEKENESSSSGHSTTKDKPMVVQQLPMPTFNGPHPLTSGGVGSVEIVKPGHFIDRRGMVPLQWSSSVTGSWELTWREQAPAGSLVCALELVADAVRNEAVFPKGRIYLAFSVWSRQKLTEYQRYKVDCQAASKLHLQERDDQILKMKQTNNLLAKAVHYRNAFAALEQYSLQPHETMAKVPSNSEVFPVSEDVFLSSKGAVWLKEASTAFMSPVRSVMLGTATLKLPAPGTSSSHPENSTSSLGYSKLSP